MKLEKGFIQQYIKLICEKTTYSKLEDGAILSLLLLNFFLFIRGSISSWLFPSIITIQYIILVFLIINRHRNLEYSNIDGLSIFFFIIFNPSGLYLNFFSFYIILIFATMTFFWWIRTNRVLDNTISLRQTSLIILGFFVGIMIFLIKILLIDPKLIINFSQHPSFLLVGLYSSFSKGIVTEEFVFRGFLFRFLRKKAISEKWIILISSILWGLFHIGVVQSIFNIFDIILGGLVFGFLASKTKSITTSLGAHAGYNAMVTFVETFTNAYLNR